MIETIDASQQSIDFAPKRIDNNATLPDIQRSARTGRQAASKMMASALQALCVHVDDPLHGIDCDRGESIVNLHA